MARKRGKKEPKPPADVHVTARGSAYTQGFNAANAGQLISQCPYPLWSVCYPAWRDGHKDASSAKE